MTGNASGQERLGTTDASSPAMSAGDGSHPAGSSSLELSPRQSVKERRQGLLLGLLLLGFGVYHSVLYFGFHPVPNSDFCAFVKTGEELLSFQLPSNYKRAPVLCVLLVGLSRLVGGPHPELTAGWLLNGVLHPFNLLLFWLIGRKIHCRSATFVAIIAILNPVSMDLLTDPVAETTLLFFTLLTLYLIGRRSRWAYVLASVTTMVRYEGAALIVAALVVDIIENRARRERISAMAAAVLASLPLGLWMVGTVVSLRGGSSPGVHYLQSIGATSGGKLVLVEFLKVLSRVAFSPLLELWPGPGWAIELLRRTSQAAGLLALGAGTVFGLVRRNRSMLALSIFLWLYVGVHAFHPFVYPRFCSTVAGIALIIAWYGAVSTWEAIHPKLRLSEAVRRASQWLAFAIAGLWLAVLLCALPSAARASERSASVPYVGMAVVALIAVGLLLQDRGKNAAVILGASLATSLVIVSNQFTLVRVLGDGQRGAEYRELADWFRTNAQPGEGIVCANTCAVELYAPERKGDVTHFFNVKAGSPSEFVERCREKRIAYVAWDSDTGQSIGSYYYRLFRYENVEALREPKSHGPYEFVKQIDSEQGNRITVFRIQTAPPGEAGR